MPDRRIALEVVLDTAGRYLSSAATTSPTRLSRLSLLGGQCEPGETYLQFPDNVEAARAMYFLVSERELHGIHSA